MQGLLLEGGRGGGGYPYYTVNSAMSVSALTNQERKRIDCAGFNTNEQTIMLIINCTVIGVVICMVLVLGCHGEGVPSPPPRMFPPLNGSRVSRLGALYNHCGHTGGSKEYYGIIRPIELHSLA